MYCLVCHNGHLSGVGFRGFVKHPGRNIVEEVTNRDAGFVLTEESNSHYIFEYRRDYNTAIRMSIKKGSIKIKKKKVRHYIIDTRTPITKLNFSVLH